MSWSCPTCRYIYDVEGSYPPPCPNCNEAEDKEKKNPLATRKDAR